jgi:hypothetical protein
MEVNVKYLPAYGNAVLVTRLTCSHTRLLAVLPCPGFRFTMISSVALRRPSWLNSNVGWWSPSTDTFRKYLRVPENTMDRFIRTWRIRQGFCYHFFFNSSTAPWGPRPPHFSRLHDHTFRHTKLGRTPLDEGPARRRDLYLTTHNTHNRQTSMSPVEFFFFFACPGFFPFDPFLYCPSCHFTLHTTVLTTNTTQTSMPPVRFEPTILASERPKTHALDRTATGIGHQ